MKRNDNGTIECRLGYSIEDVIPIDDTTNFQGRETLRIKMYGENSLQLSSQINQPGVRYTTRLDVDKAKKYQNNILVSFCKTRGDINNNDNSAIPV